MKSARKIIMLSVLLLMVAVTFISCTKAGGGVPVTDENGNPVTDANGDVITVIPSTEVVTVTDESGVAVTDKNGDALTTVIYHDVTVAVPVTDKNGKAVTDEDGNAVTKPVVITPTYPDETKKTTKPKPGTTKIVNVPLTGNNGVTVTDTQGNPVTYTDIVSETSAPAPIATSWKKTFGGSHQDYMSDVVATKDGGYIALSICNSTDGDLKGLLDNFSTPVTVLVKFDKDGIVQWKKAIGSGKGVTTLTTVEIGSDGSIYAAGYSTIPGDGQSKRGSYDAIVYKFDATGEKLWAKSFGTSTVDVFFDIAVLGDGSVVCAGSVGTNDGDVKEFDRSVTDSSCCIVEYSASGNKVMAKILGGARDRFQAVCPAKDGGFYLSAVIYSDYFFDCKGKSDAAIIKLDKNGNKKWVTPVGGSDIEYFPAITLASDGDGCVIAGRSNSMDGFFGGELSSKGEYDAYLVRVDDTGLLYWGTALRGQYDDNISDIVCSSDGYVVTGYSKSTSRDLRAVGNRGGQDIILACFDYGGDLSWVKGFGGGLDESAEGLCFSKSGGYIVAGRTLSGDNDLAGISGQKSNGEYTVGVIFKYTK